MKQEALSSRVTVVFTSARITSNHKPSDVLMTAISQPHRCDITIEKHFNPAGDSTVTLIGIDGEDV